jgi:hypothetical protein
MACRGVHFAINPEETNKLLSASDDDELIEVIQDEIEEKWDEDWLRETDKAWDAIHRCLTDGKLEFSNGSFPLNACIMGGQQLHKGDDYIISLVHPSKVSEVASALVKVTKQEMREKYFSLDPKDYDGEIGEDDFRYTWEWFSGLPDLFQKAADDGRAMLFTVNQ